jgi:hypothetical protein
MTRFAESGDRTFVASNYYKQFKCYKNEKLKRIHVVVQIRTKL